MIANVLGNFDSAGALPCLRLCDRPGGRFSWFEVANLEVRALLSPRLEWNLLPDRVDDIPRTLVYGEHASL